MPGIPQVPAAAPVSPTRIALSWPAVTDATDYDIERNGVIIARRKETSYTDTGLTPGVAYSYRLRSVNTTRSLPALPWAGHVGTATSLAEETTFLTDLDAATDRVRIVTLGASAQGRALRAVIVGPPRTRDQIGTATTAMIMGCHHGDELAGREALLEHMLNHAGGTSTDTYIYLPTVNPDGFSIPQRNLANGSDPNRQWSQTGTNAQPDAGAYFPEQQAVRQAILLWRPKIVLDTHEYTSTSATYRFDPGTTNATGTPQAVIDMDVSVLNAMRTAATSAGYAISNYSGAIPDEGATQAWKYGGIPAVFTETPQEAAGGLTLRRAMQLNSLNAFTTWMQTSTAALTDLSAAASWWAGWPPSVSDNFTG